MISSGIFRDVRILVGKSLVYGVGSIFLKAIPFLLLPIYTRYLAPQDYGVIALTSAITTALSILYPLGLHGAVTRFYFNARDEIERHQSLSTIWIGIIIAAVGMTFLLDRFGEHFFSILFRSVPFVPYIRLSIWTAFFNSFNLFPLALFQSQEHPGRYVLTTVCSALLTAGLIFGFVVFQRRGVYGYLLSTLIAAIVMAIPYILIALYKMPLTIKWNVLKTALTYSLPLVPHSLAAWVLELSDRAILERFVSLSDLGLYSLGYQFGGLLILFAMAINQAWVPFLFKKVGEQGEDAKSSLARLTTYFVLAVIWSALGLALFAQALIAFMTAPAFHSAYRVTLWVVGGQLLSGLYFIPGSFLFLKEKTKLLPIVTVVSGTINIGLNLWLVPYFGIMAAAWATLISYGVMFGLVWAIASQVYPFPYEYQRLVQIGLVAGGIFIVGSTFSFSAYWLEGIVRGLLWLAFPFALIFIGFADASEKATFITFLRRLSHRP